MISPEIKSTIDELERHCRNLHEIARVGLRHKKSLAGSNAYARRFHEADVGLTRTQARLAPILTAAGFDGTASGNLAVLLDAIRSPTSTNKQREDASKQVKMICQASILPAIEALSANPVPSTEQILPLDVIRGIRPAFEKIVIQANGCYEHQWYDACSVMIRRFIETLIIEVYEAKARSAEIKHPNGNYFMLGDLVSKILTESTWGLGRETRAALPEIKTLGDRAAHNRYFSVKKGDIDKILSGFRVSVDSLLHLANLK